MPLEKSPVTQEQIEAAKRVRMYSVLQDSGVELRFDADTIQQFRCPLHGDGIDSSGQGSARLYPEANGAKCWGCSEWYDPIGWVQSFHGLDFHSAVRFLCEEYTDFNKAGEDRSKPEIEGRVVLEVLEEETQRLFSQMGMKQKVAISQTLDKLWAVGCTTESQAKVESFLKGVKDAGRTN